MTVALLPHIKAHLDEIVRLAQHRDIDMLLAIEEVAVSALTLLRIAPPPTKRQLDAYEFIVAFTAEHRHAPSYDEIALGLGLASKSNTHRMVQALVGKGWIHRGSVSSVRSLTVVERPRSHAHDIRPLGTNDD